MISNLLKLKWSRFAAMFAAMSPLGADALGGVASFPPLTLPLLPEGLCCCCSDATS